MQNEDLIALVAGYVTLIYLFYNFIEKTTDGHDMYSLKV